MATKNNISILGCGWLGLPLAKTLAAHGFHIKGSTTSHEKIDVLAAAGIEPFLVTLSAKEILGDIADFLHSSATLIIDVPPKQRSEESEDYSDKIRKLMPYIEKAGVKNVLFISSTSVYGNGAGVATEETEPQPQTKNGEQLLESEKLLLENEYFQTTVLRFGGLVADDRHPVKFLAGRENIENPDAPINLIHREDCLSIIIRIIENKIWGEIFNAVAPFHPTREEYYTQKARALQLPLPSFSRKNQSQGKQVNSGKLGRIVHYNFLHPEL
ncbi:MAG: SDR family NAD(P)-dependent oxidoreductase [Flavobacterium sp.]|uniref:NAD(P)H-binding protein n=1 Tax=Flavobacterium sp. TaxID=239 RepID=UPI0012278068|nr:NAD(P)H-binding protein [Flavobacterium sp.]RZJ68464.1 MAG: SDR family NAD(P)-dependent oxidoreductase [Flavobacterium sp.]